MISKCRLFVIGIIWLPKKIIKKQRNPTEHSFVTHTPACPGS